MIFWLEDLVRPQKDVSLLRTPVGQQYCQKADRFPMDAGKFVTIPSAVKDGTELSETDTPALKWT